MIKEISAETLLQRLRAQGVEFWIDNNQLTYSVPGSCERSVYSLLEQNIAALAAVVKREPGGQVRRTEAPQTRTATTREQLFRAPDECFRA